MTDGSQTGNLDGTVVDSSGNPLLGAMVTITGPSFLIQYSNPQGQFQFLEIQPGSYEVIVELAGYTVATQPANIIAGKTTNIQITLKIDL